jgi:hypothetical protein
MTRERELKVELARSVMACHEEHGLVPQYYINEARNAVDGHEQLRKLWKRLG